MSWWTELRRIRDALVESDSVIYAVYPITVDEQSPGQALVQGAADVWGVWTTIIATDTIATKYWYVGTQLLNTGQAGDDAAVQICQGDGAGGSTQAIDEIEWRLMTAADQDFGMPLSQVPYPVLLPAKAELSGRSAGKTGGKTVTVSVKVATGL